MSRIAITRRNLLQAGLYGGLGAALTACSETVHKAASTKPAGSDIGAIDHLVFLMYENRSFDHYFGTYPGVRGFDDHPAGELGAFAQAWPGNDTLDPPGVLLPYHLDTTHQTAECTYDLSHAWTAQHQSWNGGSMSDFVKVHTSAQYEGPVHGPLTMGYYTREDLPFYYALADAFTICDNNHCSVFGPTDPNRLFYMSGTNDPDGIAGGPIITTNSDPQSMWSVSWKTMPEVLEQAGVSWKFYNPPGKEFVPTQALAKEVSLNIMMYFEQFKEPSSELFKKAFLSTFPADLAHDVATDNLPAVSWVIPTTFPVDHCEHPPAPPALGEWYTSQVLEALTSNPKVWARTALIINYDENDGFFDHVSPPTAPAGTPGEYLTVDPLPDTAGGIAGPTGLGIRVPMMVVSPFSRGGYVCSQVYDHTSCLRLIETRFGVKVPNVSDWRRKTVGDLTEALHLSHSETTTPALPATSQSPRSVATECQAVQLLELNVNTPAYPIPVHQQMPTQEPGSRPQV
ncbi:MAG: alkaline phosphatase family protein [Acidimicrobiales bacterium]